MFRLITTTNKLKIQQKFPFLISGLLLTRHIKQNFSLARLFESRYFVKIVSDKDLEELKKNYMKELESAQNVHVELRDNSLKEDKFKELFDTLSKSQKEEMHLDLSNTSLSDTSIKSLTDCLSNWKLKSLSLHLSNIKLTDSQFETVIKTLENMKSLSRLNLEMENVDMNRKKQRRIEDLITHLPDLTQVSINLRNNKLSDEDANQIMRMLDRFDIKHFFF
jgi:hypothetical protein